MRQEILATADPRDGLLTFFAYDHGARKKLSTIMSDILPPVSRDVVYFCIGDSRTPGDSVGPRIGSILKRRDKSLYVYGTMQDPINSRNLDDVRREVKAKHPRAFILAIDASVGHPQNVGRIWIRRGSFYPGLGVHKDFGSIGDASLWITVARDHYNRNVVLCDLHNTPVAFAHFLARVVAGGLLHEVKSSRRGAEQPANEAVVRLTDLEMGREEDGP